MGWSRWKHRRTLGCVWRRHCALSRCQAHDRRPLVAGCTLGILPMDTLGSFRSTAGTTAKGTWRCRTNSCGCVGTRTPRDGSSCRSTGSSSTSCNWRAISADRQRRVLHSQFVFVFFVIFLSCIASSTAGTGKGDDRPCCRLKTCPQCC